MSYISIYRKYRPQSFSEVVGQDEIVKTLQNSIKSNRLSHAYIFCGPRGTGKTTAARIFAKAVNCLNNVDKNGKVINPEPCNECVNCRDITNGMSVDLIEIDAASNTGIDNVRKLIENAQYLPNFLRKKIYIIDEIHNIGGGTTKAAFHALLKILEEPPENVIFVLATTEPQKVIPTILSRCQRFDFKPISADDIKKRLKIISKLENIEVSDMALNLISKYSDGSQRDANVILEKIASLDDDKVKVEDVVSLLGAVDLEILFELAGILIESNSEEAIFFISRLEKLHQNLEVFVEKFIEHLQNLYFVKNNPNGFDFINSGEEYREKYLDQSRLVSNRQLNEFILIFMDLLNKIKLGQPAWILFRSGIIKALNIKIEANGAVTQKLENSVRELNERFDNFKDSFKDVLKIAASSGAQSTKTDDVMTKAVARENTENSGNAKVVRDEEKPAAKKAETKQKTHPATGSEITKIEWEKVLNIIKNKSVSLNSLLLEVKKYNTDGSKIMFYLPDIYSWHKDKLNSPENKELVRSSLNSVMGKNFQIEFLLENQGKDLVDLRRGNPYKERNSEVGEKSVIFKGSEKSTETKKEDKTDNKEKEYEETAESENGIDETYGYMEKKFKIKE
ncbi:MAG TPA: DNA polymerase III subunit gamma/tau [Actinobacteria bacterium]|nr:DNA polymerase III subunit gamma/tau [Actinomycetota bacterium]